MPTCLEPTYGVWTSATLRAARLASPARFGTGQRCFHPAPWGTPLLPIYASETATPAPRHRTWTPRLRRPTIEPDACAGSPPDYGMGARPTLSGHGTGGEALSRQHRNAGGSVIPRVAGPLLYNRARGNAERSSTVAFSSPRSSADSRAGRTSTFRSNVDCVSPRHSEPT